MSDITDRLLIGLIFLVIVDGLIIVNALGSIRQSLDRLVSLAETAERDRRGY